MARRTMRGGQWQASARRIAAAVVAAAGCAAHAARPDPWPADATTSPVEATGVRVAWWTDAEGAKFGVTLPDGAAAVRPADYTLYLRAGAVDPLRAAAPVRPLLAAAEGSTLRIVQFQTQALPEYRAALEARGARILGFLPNHAYLVHLDSAAHAAVRDLPYVRWIGAYHPEFRLEDELRDGLAAGTLTETARYHIQVAGKGLESKLPLVEGVVSAGGTVEACIPEGFIVEATLSPEQLLEVIHRDDVLFVDRWFPPREYMDNVRIAGGANSVEAIAGYDGAGVRGEVMDGNLLDTHADFQAHPPILHGARSGSASHGTPCYGIIFGGGVGNAAGRGVAPGAQGIFADFSFLTNRYAHTAELTQAPYNALFQSNSWGSCCTTQYGTSAAAIDDMLFDLDFVLLQAQANEGSQNSDVIAFAKNLVSVGGIRHQNTSSLADDVWQNAGSIGPASDGRIKPDLSFWYESIFTTSSSGGYTAGFGGTSAATPTTAGHFALFFQMWSEGIFGNAVDPSATPFENRPHMSTAKAMMINTARPYPFSSLSADLRRMTQGWGLPNVQRLHDLSGQMFVVDETDVLRNLQTREYLLDVAPGAAEFRATLVYADPPGAVGAARHRVNDLTLKVTSPGGTVYWGNNGLNAGNVSTAGGASNVVDTVENVWLNNPAAGRWRVEVLAVEVVQDGHVETPEIDVDYALVVSGIVPPVEALPGDMNCDGVITLSDVAGFVLALTDPDGYAAQFPACDPFRADLDGSGTITVSDIAPFVALLVP